MTAVKVCGLTRVEDVEAACALGAAYVGFNFSTRSQRRVDLEAARTLAAATSADVRRVGVFVDEGYDAIDAAIQAGGLDLLQLHRPLREQDLRRLRRPIVAVAHPGVGDDFPEPELLVRCAALLLDGAREGAVGGTGAAFDWSIAEERRWPVPLFLAGGLDPENVGESIRRLRPAVVDVASGVERSPGVKDRDRMRRFFEAVERADMAT